MSVFDPEEQNKHLDKKIVAGLERLSQVFRTLLWDQAKVQQLSPIQIQLLVFIRYHSNDKNNVSYLAEEFGVTRPTISDAIKVLFQKNMVKRISDTTDSRRYSITLTAAGRKVVTATENFTAPFTQWTNHAGLREKEVLWQSITGLIRSLNQEGLLTVQRNCYSCRYYTQKNDTHFCQLLNQKLEPVDIRIDCPEHVLQSESHDIS